MRKQINIKQLVAVLLPIVVILGIVYSISNMISLQADDSSTKLTVIKADKDITGKDTTIPEPSVNLKLTAKENQLYRLPKKDNLSVVSPSSDTRSFPTRRATSSDFDLEKELSTLKDEAGKEKQSNELIYVTDDKTSEVTTYLKLLKDKTEELVFARENAGDEFDVELENVEAKNKQKLFTFNSAITEESSDKSDEEKVNKETKDSKEPDEPEAEPIKGDETLEELEQRSYSKKESFKPIELPLEETTKKKTKSADSVKVTNAKIKVRSGTGTFDDPKDGDTHPGYDKDDKNEWVRTFDSSIYILSFSLEGSNPGVKYSDIKYRVDMDLPNAFGFDSAGKKRENFGIEADSTEGLTDEVDGTKTDNGYVESTINSNGQILLPIFVNVFGAQHKTPIEPTFKITIISAKNENTGVVETINNVYDKNNLTALDVPTKKVSADPSVTTTITKGNQATFGDTISGGSWSASTRNNWQVAGIGVAIKLAPLSGRGDTDFRGSTFPATDIDITLKTPESRYKPATLASTTVPWNIVPPTTSSTSTTGAYPIKIVAGRWASTSNVASEWSWVTHEAAGRTLKINDSILAMNLPYGRGLRALREQPTDADKKKIGVYDTGDKGVSFPSDVKIKLSSHATEGYQPIWNEYTYNMDGSSVSKNDKYFASVSLFVEWSNLYFASQPSSAKSYQSDIAVDTISYEGKTHAGGSDIQTLTANSDPGVLSQHVPFTYAHDQETGRQGVSLSVPSSAWNGAGNAIVPRGYEFSISARYSDQQFQNSNSVLAYVRWNANSIEYDSTKKTMMSPGGHIGTTWTYGVKNSGNSPPINYRTMVQIEGEYTWYPTPEAALAKGKISALKIQATKNCHGFAVQIPVKAIGPLNNYSDGETFGAGHRNVCLMNSEVRDLNGNIKFSRPDYRSNQYYESSVFNTSGVKTGGHYIRTTSANTPVLGTAGDMASAGDTLFISGASITTTTAPEKPTYKTNENVVWKVTGNASGGNENHKVRLTTTLPKGLKYVDGSSKLTLAGSTSSITPTVTTDGSGNTVLVWNVTGVNPSKGDKPEITFETTSDIKNLTFTDSSITEAEIKTVGEIWISSLGEDKTNQETRTSYGKVQLYQIQQISLEKSVSPDYIEVGDNDALIPTLSTDIKYTIKLTNNSSDTLANVRVLDVLPYDNDVLKSSLDSSASYKISGVKFVKGSGKVYHNKTIPIEKEINDPNEISTSGWGTYTPGGTPIASIQDSKAILIEKDTMAVDEVLEFEITISPTGQKAGNIFRNQAVFNSHLDLPVKSNIVETKVYGRDLTGYVWYDDDYDGLIGTKSDGSPEDSVGNIPVKLYRTSTEDPSHKDQLVKESLTGEKFIDSSGDSLIKTGSDGKYTFSNLPEGNYVAEFVIDDIVITKKIVIVTKEWQGTDVSLNSKADPDPTSATAFKTPSDFKDPNATDGSVYFNHPKLSDLPTILSAGEFVHHIPQVNAGLTRLSKIRLFKYEEGTVVDDGDGILTDKEIEASTTHALEGAEFQLYKGKKDDPDTIKDENKVGSVQVTDASGWLEFPSLPPGDYTIVETKAPAGFELLKEPIEVHVPTYNYIAIVHVPDHGQTKLPFTGSTKAMRIILIAAACLLVVGMTGVFLHFRPIKVRGGN